MQLPYQRAYYSDSPMAAPGRPRDFIIMTVFDIYADESGKLGKNTDYISFCGYIAHVSEWGRFDQEWNNSRLRFQVPPIHMSRIMAPDNKDDEWKCVKEEWGDEWEVRRDLMLRDLGAIVRSAEVLCFNRLATFFIGSNRLWAAQLYHH